MGRVAAFIATAALLVLGLMFSAVLLAFILIAGLIAFAYIWWKTRAIRRQMRGQFTAANDAEAFKTEIYEGEIIEGEVIRKVVSIEEIKR